eukprot:GFYU01018335.1.p1 GENE.GFYU01018335.1~~GFYU01018335.1.p1  ORF type:complete len:352 (+),score=52.55 GFYU01018335.1:175-1230(+)
MSAPKFMPGHLLQHESDQLRRQRNRHNGKESDVVDASDTSSKPPASEARQFYQQLSAVKTSEKERRAMELKLIHNKAKLKRLRQKRQVAGRSTVRAIARPLETQRVSQTRQESLATPQQPTTQPIGEAPVKASLRNSENALQPPAPVTAISTASSNRDNVTTSRSQRLDEPANAGQGTSSLTHSRASHGSGSGGTPSDAGLSDGHGSSFYCELCKETVVNVSVAAHESSISHNFNKPIESKPTVYAIPKGNPGYQMMTNAMAWDEHQGLGADGQGRMVPLKTRLKNDRLGVGKKPLHNLRITHDPTEIPRRRPTSKSRSQMTRKEIRYLEKKEKLTDELIRHALYRDHPYY